MTQLLCIGGPQHNNVVDIPEGHERFRVVQPIHHDGTRIRLGTEAVDHAIRMDTYTYFVAQCTTKVLINQETPWMIAHNLIQQKLAAPADVNTCRLINEIFDAWEAQLKGMFDDADDLKTRMDVLNRQRRLSYLAMGS